MRYVIVAISAVIILGMLGYRYSVYSPTPSLHPTIRAVYLVNAPGQLEQRDLDSHQEVVVTGSFDKLKEYAKWRVALLIDGNVALQLTEEERSWFKSLPQAGYPIAVIGYGDRMYAFRGLIPLQCLAKDSCGPFQMVVFYSGFSVYQRDPARDTPKFWEGYTYKPDVQDILNITNRLLDNTLNATPAPTDVPE